MSRKLTMICPSFFFSAKADSLVVPFQQEKYSISVTKKGIMDLKKPSKRWYCKKERKEWLIRGHHFRRSYCISCSAEISSLELYPSFQVFFHFSLFELWSSFFSKSSVKEQYSFISFLFFYLISSPLDASFPPPQNFFCNNLCKP